MKGDGPLNRDFISIASMEGELKLSHKKQGYGYTVTTREFIIQKPHSNYYLQLSDIISILPAEPYGLKPVRHMPEWPEHAGLVSVAPGSKHYRIMVRQAVIHNRSGMRTLRACDFILPMDERMFHAVISWSGLDPIGGGPSGDHGGG